MKTYTATHWRLFTLIIFILETNSVSAGEFSTQIETASLELQNDWYLLNADVKYQLSPTAKAALENGIPLVWQLEAELRQPQLLKDKVLVHKNYTFKIRYRALLNSYTLKNETTAEVKKFASLSAAIDAAAQIRHLPVFSVNQLDRNQAYKIAIKLNFDREALPLPLRPEAYLSWEWNLSSNWFRWTLEPLSK